MTPAPQPPLEPSTDVRRELMTSLGQASFREFNVAFVLMSLIPIFIGVYVLAARLFTIDIFQGMIGVFFVIAIVFALLGFVVGRRIIRAVLAKLVEANVKLRRHEAMKSSFVANVAYELRPPLAAVQVSLKNVIDGLLGPLTASQQQTVQTCHQVVGRLVRLTADLIDVTDLTKGGPSLARDVFELRQLVHDVVQASQPALAAHRFQVALRLPEQAVLFFGDRGKLQQALSALIEHAIRWCGEGGAISVELAALPQEWRFSISHDVESGQADFARLLDTFTRLGGHTEESLGLGLHLVKEIAELHHGRFWTEASPAQGIRLIMALPALELPTQPVST